MLKWIFGMPLLFIMDYFVGILSPDFRILYFESQKTLVNAQRERLNEQI